MCMHTVNHTQRVYKAALGLLYNGLGIKSTIFNSPDSYTNNTTFG